MIKKEHIHTQQLATPSGSLKMSNAIHIVPEHILSQMSPVYRLAYKKARAIVDGKRIDMDEFDYSDVEADKIATKQRISGMNSLSKAEGGGRSLCTGRNIRSFFIHYDK